MPTFAEQYKQLFGVDLDFDPIDIDANDAEAPTPRLDLTGGGFGGPDEAPVFNDFQSKLNALDAEITRSGPAADEPGFMGDVGRTLAAGAVQTGGLAVGAAEYAARQLGDDSNFGQYLIGEAVGPLSKARQATMKYSEDILAGMSEDSQDQIRRQFLTLDPEQTIWQGGPGEVMKSVGLKFSQALPATVLTLLPAARMFRAGMTPGAVAYLGASEGGLSLGGIANGVAEEIESLDEDTLRKESPFYNDLRSQGMAEEEARSELIRTAQGASPLIGGVLVGAISSVAGRYLEPIFAGKGAGIGQRFTQGFGIEAAQEAPQSTAEQYMQNVAAQVYENDRPLSEGVAEATVEGGIIGGLTGGAFTAAMGARPSRPPPERLADDEEGGAPGPTPEPTEPGNAVVPSIVPGQQEFQFTRRERGYRNAPLPGRELRPEPVDYSLDTAQPPGVAPDPRQGDLFGEQPLDQFDITGPSAEPLADLDAQFRELDRPEAEREGVYLSSKSVANLEQQGALEEYLGKGIAIANFSEQGDVLVVRDREVADRVMEDKNTGRDLDMTLGEVTGAGIGRPEGGDTVVQRRDETGSVVQERLAADEAEAEQIATEWEQRYPNFDVLVMTAPASIRRRNTRIRYEHTQLEQARIAEQEARTAAIQRQKAQDRVRRAGSQLDPAVAEEAATAPTPEKAAARLLGVAAREASQGEQRRIGGFLPPNQLEFADEREEVRYRNRFNKLVEIELFMEQHRKPENDSIRMLKSSMKGERAQILDELAEIRGRAKPTRKVLKTVRAASRVSPKTTRAAIRDARKRGTKRPQEAPETPLVDDQALRDLSDEQIDKLSGDKLEGVFKQAADWLSGRYRAMTLTYEGQEAPSAETLPEGAELIAISTPVERKIKPLIKLESAKREKGWSVFTLKQGEETTTVKRRGTIKAEKPKILKDIEARNAAIKRANAVGVKGGVTMDELADKFRTAAAQRKLIRRVKNQLLKREFGGGVRSKPITKSAVRTSVKRVPRRKGKFDTTVLGAEKLPKDESRVDRRARVNKAKKVRDKLDRTLRRATNFSDKMNSGKFAELAQERDTKGNLSDAARDLIYAKAYFRYIADFATAMRRSNNKANDIIAEMEKVEKFIADAIKMPAPDFSRVFGNLLRAESLVSAKEGTKALPDQAKDKLNDPEQREEVNAKIMRGLMADTARMMRLEENWKTNSYYNTVVAPLIHKFYDSAARDGYPSYQPTEEELMQLQWVLDGWKVPRLRKDMYTPIRYMLTRLGLEWDANDSLVIPRDEEGKYNYQVADRALVPLYRSRFGQEVEDAGIVLARREQYSGPQFTPAAVERREADAIISAERADRTADIAQFGRLAQANRIIKEFREFIGKPKTTIAGFIRAEQRLIRAFKELGLWRDTPSSEIGRVLLREPRTYRMVGPRLEAKKVGKEEARKLLLKGIRPQALPKEFAKDPSVQAREQEELAAETELFMKVTEPGPSIEQFRDVGSAIQARLDDITTHASMNELMEIISAGLPADHMYTKLAQQIHDMKMDDVPVSWDWRGQAQDVIGRAKWESDATMPNGVFRYIILNKAKVSKQRDPAHTTIHALLHEATHMATAGAMDVNRPLREAVGILRTMVREHWSRTKLPGEKMPYGIRELDPNEFVAEAFSNPEFQALLKRVKFNRTQTAWGRFVQLVKNLLGVDTAQPKSPENTYEAIMDLTHPLFTGRVRTVGSETLDMNIDPALQGYADEFTGMMEDRLNDLKRGWKRTAKRGWRAPLQLMSMRQLHKEFRRHFGGVGNSFDRYKEAWEKRDAENSRLMKIGEDLSRTWTHWTEKTGVDKALEFSRLATESSLYTVHPDRPVDHPTNEHLVSDEQKAKHAELSKRFNAMPEQWRGLWKKVQSYYVNALQKEIDLITVNALRGVLASGRNPSMTREQFDKHYTPEAVRELGLNTPEGLKKEFPDMAQEQIATLMEIVNIPSKREGPYFPLTRYGNYVVYAKRQSESKEFTSAKDAFGYRSSTLAKDPTLDANVKEMRDGVWQVIIEEKDFRTAESPTEAEEMREEMIEQYGQENVTDVQLKDKFNTDETIRSGSALNKILGELEGNPKAQNAIKDWWLRTLADSSFRKHEIRRKNRRGVNYDLQHRNFTNYVKKTSYYRSQLKYGWQMADAMGEIRTFVREYKQESPDDPLNTRLGEVRDHLIRRDKLTDDIQETSKAIRRGTEIGQLYMLFGPSYWMINSTQPYMVTLPWLGARYGWGASLAAMKNSQSMIIHPLLKATKESLGGLKALTSKEAAEKAFNVLDQVKTTIEERAGSRAPQYIDMLEKLREHSIIDLSWVAELRDISEGRDTSAWQKTMDATRVMGHLTEVNNRIMSALAAYDLRYQEIISRKGATHELAHAEAIEFAKQATSETHFDYSAGNKPLLFQPKGPLGRFSPLVFQFLQWPQHMYAMMISNIVSAVGRGAIDKAIARKTLAGLLATHAVAGGLIGMALQPIKWALGMAMWALGDDDDPDSFNTVVSGETFDRWARESMVKMAGPTLGKALSTGIPSVLGTDLSDRMSLGTVYFIDLKTDTAESTLGSIAAGFGGPWINLMIGATKGINLALEGDYQIGIEYVLPKAFKDISRAFRYSQEGLVNNAGDTVLNTDGVSPYQLFLQTLGFRPSEVSDFYSRQSLIKDTERYGTQRRSTLLKRFRTASSIEERNRVLEEVREFNKVWPAAAITRSSLIRAVNSKAEREASYKRYGANLRGRAIIYSKEGQYYQ